jgi:hypothetical protein
MVHFRTRKWTSQTLRRAIRWGGSWRSEKIGESTDSLKIREEIGKSTDSVENPARLKIMRGLVGLV